PARHVHHTVNAHVHRARAHLLLEVRDRPRPLLEPPQAHFGPDGPTLPNFGRAPLPLELERGGVAALELGLLTVRGAAAQALFFFDSSREESAEAGQLVVAMPRDFPLPFALAVLHQRLEVKPRVRHPSVLEIVGERFADLVETFARAYIRQLVSLRGLDQAPF